MEAAVYADSLRRTTAWGSRPSSAKGGGAPRAMVNASSRPSRRLEEALTAGSRSRARGHAQMELALEDEFLNLGADSGRADLGLADPINVLHEARSYVKAQLRQAMEALRESTTNIEVLEESRLYLKSQQNELTAANQELEERAKAAEEQAKAAEERAKAAEERAKAAEERAKAAEELDVAHPSKRCNHTAEQQVSKTAEPWQDHQDIQNTIYRFASVIDGVKPIEALSEVFVDPMEFGLTHEGNEAELKLNTLPRDLFAASLVSIGKKYVATHHRCSNSEIILGADGPGTASAITYCHHSHKKFAEHGGGLFEFVGRLEDKLLKTPEGWRITQRKQIAHYEMGEVAPAPPAPPNPPKKKIVRQPALKAPRVCSAVGPAKVTEFDYSKADPAKWVFSEQLFNGGARAVSMGKKENVQGKISEGVVAFKANPAKYYAMWYQSSMTEWPEDQQKYTLLHRKGTKGYKPADVGPDGWMKILTAKYQRLPPIEAFGAAGDKHTDGMSCDGRRIRTPE